MPRPSHELPAPAAYLCVLGNDATAGGAVSSEMSAVGPAKSPGTAGHRARDHSAGGGINTSSVSRLAALRPPDNDLPGLPAPHQVIPLLCRRPACRTAPHPYSGRAPPAVKPARRRGQLRFVRFAMSHRPLRAQDLQLIGARRKVISGARQHLLALILVRVGWLADGRGLTHTVTAPMMRATLGRWGGPGAGSPHRQHFPSGMSAKRSFSATISSLRFFTPLAWAAFPAGRGVTAVSYPRPRIGGLPPDRHGIPH